MNEGTSTCTTVLLRLNARGVYLIFRFLRGGGAFIREGPLKEGAFNRSFTVIVIFNCFVIEEITK